MSPVWERRVLWQATLPQRCCWACLIYEAPWAVTDPCSQSLRTFTCLELNACVTAVLTASTQEMAGAPSEGCAGTLDLAAPNSSWRLNKSPSSLPFLLLHHCWMWAYWVFSCTVPVVFCAYYNYFNPFSFFSSQLNFPCGFVQNIRCPSRSISDPSTCLSGCVSICPALLFSPRGHFPFLYPHMLLHLSFSAYLSFMAVELRFAHDRIIWYIKITFCFPLIQQRFIVDFK